jgi:hypothetical protein
MLMPLFINQYSIAPKIDKGQTIIGSSVENLDITAHHFGGGEKEILLVGGIHGGYEWNSSLLAYELIEYFESNSDAIPENLQVTIIPNLNPDGLYAVTKKTGAFTKEDVSLDDTFSARFNSNNVDLNRNFDCKWQPNSTWRNTPTNAGSHAFSEPETKALRDYILKKNPISVVFWHSQANTVYGSECENGILAETESIMNTYAKAASYGAERAFTAYPVTGDAADWLASINIPAISVELENHNSIDWEINLSGLEALFEYYR